MMLLLRILLLTALACGSADAQMMQSIVSGKSISGGGGSYTGPGDVVASATAWWSCARGYNLAYATSGTGKACNVRRQNDSVACDLLIASNGNLGLTTATCNSSTQGGITAAAFAGTDATASCSTSGSSTSLVCTGASSTPNANDVASGSGITQPNYLVSCGTFTGGAGTCTLFAAVNIASPTTVTFQNALFVTKQYDQSGATACSGSTACDVVQATTAKQPQLILSCIGGKPCLQIVASFSAMGTASGVSSALASQPITFSFVAQRFGGGTAANNAIVSCDNSSFSAFEVESGFGTAASTMFMYAGGSVVTQTATDAVTHAIQTVFNNTSSAANVDGTDATSLSPGTNGCASPNNVLWFPAPEAIAAGFAGESGVWPIAATLTQRNNMHSNQSAFWGTP